jgi:hypothetical protein
LIDTFMTDESSVMRNWQADSRRRTVAAPDVAGGADADPDPGPTEEGSRWSLTAVDVGRRPGERPRPGP